MDKRQAAATPRRVIGFSDQELAANRDGKITEQQYARLWRKTRNFFILPVVMIIATIVLGALSVRELRELMMGVLLLFLAMLAIGYKKARGAVWNNHPAVIEGHIQTKAIESEMGTMYWLKVANRNISLSKETFDSLRDGEYVRVYYVPAQFFLHEAMFLSMENTKITRSD